MEKKNIDWGNIGFGYIPTDYRFVSKFKDGKWDEGELTTDPNVVLNECACVFQYAQTVFEGMKAYTTEDGHIVTFRPDLNAERLANSAKRLEMPVFPEDRFVDAVVKTIKANEAYVPPYGSGATLYVRPYMFGSNPVIGVKPADEYQFRILTTPVGPYFKGGAKPITIRVTDFDRAAPHGTGHIKAGWKIQGFCRYKKPVGRLENWLRRNEKHGRIKKTIRKGSYYNRNLLCNLFYAQSGSYVYWICASVMAAVTGRDRNCDRNPIPAYGI